MMFKVSALRKTKIALFFVTLSLSAILNALEPAHIFSTTQGTDVSIYWSPIDGADGYELLYTASPYIAGNTISSIDLGNTTSISADLGAEASFHIALVSYNSNEKSNYSNVVTIDPKKSDTRYRFSDIVDSFENRFSVIEENNVTLRVGDNNYEFPESNDYKVGNFGFFEVLISGTHGGNRVIEYEEADEGPWAHQGIVRPANLNGDEFEDMVIIENIQGGQIDRPEVKLYTFINDGNGGFEPAPYMFADGQFPCVKSTDDLFNPSDPNDKCGYYWSLLYRPVIEDFNGDGIDDFFFTSLLFLSENGKWVNRSDTLPSLFRDGNPLFTHGTTAGDVGNDGDIDIFIPFPSWTGESWVMLINDGKGNFTFNREFPSEYNGGFATAMTMADFNNDGFIDIGVGWFNRAYDHDKAGIILYGSENGWLESYELPNGWYVDNISNDFKTIDYNNDGLLDLVNGATAGGPNTYYRYRRVQIFQNTGSGFVDVTQDINPNNRYEFGPISDQCPRSNCPWWNGEGELRIVDFDGDGDMDIVDTVYRSYVLLNNNGVFQMYENFPRLGGFIDKTIDGSNWSPLWPMNINNDGKYDLVGYVINNNSGEPIRNESTYFQLISK